MIDDYHLFAQSRYNFSILTVNVFHHGTGFVQMIFLMELQKLVDLLIVK